MELSAYMCCCVMEPAHRILVLRNAMALAYKQQDFIYAAHFAKRILQIAEVKNFFLRKINHFLFRQIQMLLKQISLIMLVRFMQHVSKKAQISMELNLIKIGFMKMML